MLSEKEVEITNSEMSVSKEMKNISDIGKQKTIFIQCECPSIIMSKFYHTPGTLDDLIFALKGQPGDKLLLEANKAYYHCDIASAIALTKQCMEESLTFNPHIGAGLLMSLCAMDEGNSALWEESRVYIATCPCKDEKEIELREFWLAVVDSFIYDNSKLPNWFKQGCFDIVPVDSFPYVRYLFVRYCLFECKTSLYESRKENNEYMITTKNIAKICELLITQTKTEKIILSEIYLRIMGAIAYHNYGDDKSAANHLHAAIQLAIPDHLLQPFVEYQIDLDYLLEQELKKVDDKIWLEVKQGFKKLLEGWTLLHNTKLNKTRSKELTTREREISRLAAIGLSNAEIAKRLQISLYTVKHTIHHAMEKTGAQKRSDLINFI